jgi:hypothetical protein
MEDVKGQRIFLSYAAADHPRVETLSNWLLEQGFELSNGGGVATDEGRGESDRIHKANFFLACLTQNSLDKRGKIEKKLKGELDFLWKGIDNEAFLIPVRLEECLIPESLKAFPDVDVFRSEDFPALLDQMQPVIERRRKLREAFPDSITGTKSLPIDTEQISHESVDGPSDPASVYSWHIDLLRLLAGEREYSLVQLGDVDDYIETNIAEADDPSEARVAFETALEKVIQTWQPSVLDEHINQNYVLELLNKYSLESGREKVIAFAMTLKRTLSRKPVEDAERIKDLYLSALVTLENYYLSPPEPIRASWTAYQTYIDLLKEDLSSADFCGNALKRLVELKEMSLSRDEIKNLMSLNPNSLVSLIQLVLDPVRQSTTAGHLMEIYILCLEAGDKLEREFEAAIIRSGGELRRDDKEVPRICINETCFDLPEESASTYYAIMLSRANREGLEKDKEMGAAMGRS